MYTLLNFLCLFEPTFDPAVVATIRLRNPVSKLGTMFQQDTEILERDLTLLWLQLLQHQTFVHISTKVLTVYGT